MKTFKNSKGIKIFELDYNGNLYISGDLTLSPESTITAGNIKALVDADVAVIRESIDMVTPYLGKADVVYYLGENTEEYTYGTWWEKYTIGYNCTIDVSYTKVPGFTVYEGNASFYVTDNDVYSYNKEVLDSYPTTNKIVVTAINGSDIAHWEIKYYNGSTLLYTDLIESAYFTAIGYNFPFSPINSEDYPEGSTDIIINVQAEYALREINATDWESFMPKTGGEFQGIISTKDIIPLQADTYSIGTETGRYKNGYFSNIYTGYLKTNTLSIENLNLEQFTLSSAKTDLVPGDGLVITDSVENNSVKMSSTLKFSGDKTKYLRQDGTFAVPTTNIPIIKELSNVEKKDGALIFIEDSEYNSLKPGHIYHGYYSDDFYQFRMKGVTFESNPNDCIINKNKFDKSNVLIYELNQLNLGDIVNDFVEKNGEVTLAFHNDNWSIKGLEDKGTVSMNKLTAGNLRLLNDLAEDANYEISQVSNNMEIVISKFIWQSVNPVEFDYSDTSKILSKAGTWVNKPYDFKTVNVLSRPPYNELKLEQNALKSGLYLLQYYNTPQNFSAIGLVYAYWRLYTDENRKKYQEFKQYVYILDEDGILQRYSRHAGMSTNVSMTAAEQILSNTPWKKVISDGIEMEKINNQLHTLSSQEWSTFLNSIDAECKGFICVGGLYYYCILRYYDEPFTFDPGVIKNITMHQLQDIVNNRHGIVLPLQGYCNDIDINTVQDFNKVGYYHCSDDNGNTTSCIVFNSEEQTVTFKEVPKMYKCSVRLAIKDLEHGPTPVNSVQFGLNSENPIGFVPTNLDYHSLSNQFRLKSFISDGQTNKTQIDNSGWKNLFAWGNGQDPSSDNSLMDKVENINFYDWGNNNIAYITVSDDHYLTQI